MPTARPNVVTSIPPPRGNSQRSERTRWEYRSVLMPRLAELDQFGEEGWELVSVVSSPADEAVFYFKRRKA